jgi:DNA (cytosine-5)-methyltransferase 1
MRFIDLFAGLGGFHLALKQLGHECVFASEIDAQLQQLYMINFGMMPEGDIRRVFDKIPEHEILCAGFPCQPFSKAGPRDGFKNPKLGDLYSYILKIIHEHHPQYFILENVPNLEKHDDGRTWAHIETLLRTEGYDIRLNKLSPHYFDIPQIRERVYIVGKFGEQSLGDYCPPQPVHKHNTKSIEEYLGKNPPNARKIPSNVSSCLDVWQEFLDKVPLSEKIPHPLWSMEFGATYPYKKTTPLRISFNSLKRFKGSFGISLKQKKDFPSLLESLPSHARRDQDAFPNWKVHYIEKNREFYRRHRDWLDNWIPKIRVFPSSLQKLEWNCQGEKDRNIRNYILQIRPSGVRVKRWNTAPSLVAMTTTQVPIIAREERYMTPDECKSLQSMDELRLPESDCKAYEALGNAINVKVAKLVTQSLIDTKVPIQYFSENNKMASGSHYIYKKLEAIPNESDG